MKLLSAKLFRRRFIYADFARLLLFHSTGKSDWLALEQTHRECHYTFVDPATSGRTGGRKHKRWIHLYFVRNAECCDSTNARRAIHFLQPTERVDVIIQRLELPIAFNHNRLRRQSMPSNVCQLSVAISRVHGFYGLWCNLQRATTTAQKHTGNDWRTHTQHMRSNGARGARF